MSDFGDILSQWDQKKKTTPQKKKSGFAENLDRYLPDPEGWGAILAEKEEPNITWADRQNYLSRKRALLLKMEPEDEIDLHGLTRDQAQTALDRFFLEAKQEGYRKVLVIHGKGIHSEGDAVLLQQVTGYLKQSPEVDQFGYAKGNWGGKGATWVLLKGKQEMVREK